MQRIKPLLKVHAVTTKYVDLAKITENCPPCKFLLDWTMALQTHYYWVGTYTRVQGVPNCKILSETPSTIQLPLESFPEFPISKCLIPKYLIPIPVAYSCRWNHSQNVPSQISHPQISNPNPSSVQLPLESFPECPITKCLIPNLDPNIQL